MEDEVFQLRKRPPEVRAQLAHALYPEGAITEERVRQIVREELAQWEKRQVQRARFGEQFERKA